MTTTFNLETMNVEVFSLRRYVPMCLNLGPCLIAVRPQRLPSHIYRSSTSIEPKSPRYTWPIKVSETQYPRQGSTDHGQESLTPGLFPPSTPHTCHRSLSPPGYSFLWPYPQSFDRRFPLTSKQSVLNVWPSSVVNTLYSVTGTRVLVR